MKPTHDWLRRPFARLNPFLSSEIAISALWSDTAASHLALIS